MSEAAKRVLIVDDHPIVRRGLADLIAQEPDLKVCGQAGDASDALELVRTLEPDVLICDLTLNGMDGLELIKRVRAHKPEIIILVSSMHDESVYAERVLRAGAMGYVNKQETIENLVAAIRQVLEGRVYLSRQTTERMLRRNVGGPADGAASPAERLSDRELEVFRLIGEGRTTRQIAEALHISVKTIESHREHIKAKLDLSNAAELSRRAVEFVISGE